MKFAGDDAQFLKNLRAVIDTLPPKEKNILEYLLAFIGRLSDRYELLMVASEKEEDKMTQVLEQLARVRYTSHTLLFIDSFLHPFYCSHRHQKLPEVFLYNDNQMDCLKHCKILMDCWN